MDSPPESNQDNAATCEESPYTSNSISPVSSVNEPLTTLTNFTSAVVPEYTNNLNYTTTEQAIIGDGQYSYGPSATECYQSYSRANTMDPAALLTTWPASNHPVNTAMSMQGMPLDMNMISSPTTYMNSRPAFIDIPPQQYHPYQHHHPQPQSTKPKRRRIITTAQRKAANIRERRRMYNINDAFDLLRKRVPTFAYERRLSRIETLRLAIVYIGFMTDMLNGKDANDIKLRQKLFFDRSRLREEDDAVYDMAGEISPPLSNQEIESVMTC